MSDNLKEIIDRIKSGNHDEADIRAISDAFYKGQISLISGDRAVGASGDVISSQVITGDGNIVFTGTDAEAIQSILSSLNLAKQTISKGSSGFMGISTANSNQNPLGATVTALPCRQ